MSNLAGAENTQDMGGVRESFTCCRVDGNFWGAALFITPLSTVILFQMAFYTAPGVTRTGGKRTGQVFLRGDTVPLGKLNV